MCKHTSEEKLRGAKGACGDNNAACAGRDIDLPRVSGTDTAVLGTLQLNTCNVATSADQSPCVCVCPQSELWSLGRSDEVCG